MANWIESAVTFEDDIQNNATALVNKIERACRTCYRSEDKIAEGSAERLIRSCINRGHESPLEHGSITFRIICDRGVMAEITRHRLASFSIESTRYCNYGKDKFGNEITCIIPAWVQSMGTNNANWILLKTAVDDIEQTYLKLLDNGMAPENARAILPNCLKTEIVMTMNIREIRHFIKLRLSPAAHPDIRVIAGKMLEMLLAVPQLKVLFEDLEGTNV